MIIKDEKYHLLSFFGEVHIFVSHLLQYGIHVTSSPRILQPDKTFLRPGSNRGMVLPLVEGRVVAGVEETAQTLGEETKVGHAVR